MFQDYSNPLDITNPAHPASPLNPLNQIPAQDTPTVPVCQPVVVQYMGTNAQGQLVPVSQVTVRECPVTPTTAALAEQIHGFQLQAFIAGSMLGAGLTTFVVGIVMTFLSRRKKATP